jgi:hypothetical protein
MTQLLKCLVVLLQNSQTLLHFIPIQNPKVDLGPTETLSSGPTEIAIYIATCQTLTLRCNQNGSRSHRDGMTKLL